MHTALRYLTNGSADCVQIWCVGFESLPKYIMFCEGSISIISLFYHIEYFHQLCPISNTIHKIFTNRAPFPSISTPYPFPYGFQIWCVGFESLPKYITFCEGSISIISFFYHIEDFHQLCPISNPIHKIFTNRAPFPSISTPYPFPYGFPLH